MNETGLDAVLGDMDWSALEKTLGGVVEDKKKNFSDDRFWKLSRDENDNGAAIIRLLPDAKGKMITKMFNHSFNSAGKTRWYINDSPQTIKLPCPASDLWAALTNEGTEAGKEEAGSFTRKLKFIANIKVINDPANPDNNGKVFLWSFGTKLKDKIIAAMNPSKADMEMGEKPNPMFNPFKGSNIKLRIQKAGGFMNYDATTIDAPSSVYASREEAENDIINNATILAEFEDPANFSTFEELQSKLKFVIEGYKPKHLSQARFDEIVAPIIGSTVKAPEPVVQQTIQEPVVQSTPTPTQGITQEATTAVDNSLDFLDDLD